MATINLNQRLASPGDTSTIESSGDIFVGNNRRVRQSVQSAIVATGTAASGAKELTAVHNICTSVAANNNSVIFDSSLPGDQRLVANYGASTLSVFPATGGSIDNLAAVTLNSGVAASFLAYDNDKFTKVKGA